MQWTRLCILFLLFKLHSDKTHLFKNRTDYELHSWFIKKKKRKKETKGQECLIAVSRSGDFLMYRQLVSRLLN